MFGTEGYGLTALSSTVAYNLGTSQGRLLSDVTRLSSGLRIVNAADDPSGLAIAEGLQSKVLGYDQASKNVQDANNELTVADGALQTVTDILVRLRSLAVEANDDLLSSSDRSDLQTEVGQLVREIDTISQNTTVNGLSLLNGAVTYNASGVRVAGDTFASPSVGPGSNPNSYEYSPVGASWTFSTHDATGGAGITAFGTGNILTRYNAQGPPSGSAQVGFIQGTGELSQAVSGFSTDKLYAIKLYLSQRALETVSEGVNILVNGVSLGTYYPTTVNPANPVWTSVTTNVFSPSTSTPTLSFQGTDQTGENTAFVDEVSIDAVTAGKTVAVQCGADEGDVLNCHLPTASSSYLGISTISMLSTQTAASAESQIDDALSAVGSARAALGAQMVRLAEQGQNDDTSFVNLTASESAIRDANISATTMDFTSAQILTSIGTSILANNKNLASSVEKLFE